MTCRLSVKGGANYGIIALFHQPFTNRCRGGKKPKEGKSERENIDATRRVSYIAIR